MGNEFPKVFNYTDFKGVDGTTLGEIAQEAASRANKLLSERLVKRFGTIDGYFGSPNCNQAGDTHFILSTETFPIKREPVKVEISIEALRKYRNAIDDLYNHNEATRIAVVKYFGTCHSSEVTKVLEELPTKPDSEGR